MRLAPTLVLLTLAVTWWSCSNSSAPNLPPGALAERPDPLREFAGTWRGTCRAMFSCGRRLTPRQLTPKQRNSRVPCAPLIDAHGTPSGTNKACLKKLYRRATPIREFSDAAPPGC
jgi:hypothetical protein